MRLFRPLAALAAAGALAMGVAAPASAADGPVRFGALLIGENEVPGPGDGNGAAAVLVRLNVDTRRVCLIGFDQDDLARITGFHIHRGNPSVAGPVVIDLTSTLGSGGCVTSNATLLGNIVAEPNRFYFNIHTVQFPNGAVRAQLGRV
jgi:hypothetical protein